MQENNNTKPKQTTVFKKKNNKKGRGCFVCGSDEHWASACPDRKYKQEKKSANVVISETGGGTSGYGNSLPFVLLVCLHLSGGWTVVLISMCVLMFLCFISYQAGRSGALLMGNDSHAHVIGAGMVVLKFTSEKMCY